MMVTINAAYLAGYNLNTWQVFDGIAYVSNVHFFFLHCSALTSLVNQDLLDTFLCTRHHRAPICWCNQL